MTAHEPAPILLHEDLPLFRESVNFTAAETTFIPRLIEKDYFCTLLLHYLSSADGGLVLKGGTCLAEVHAEFYRLSEDLDFVIPSPIDATRSERRTRAAAIKSAVVQLPRSLGAFSVVAPLTGANNSTQYVAIIGYTSLLSQQKETIKIEIGLREPLLTPVFNGTARTILLDPISGKPMMPTVPVLCISLIEAMAEKLRAALSRREVAIRDFFDIDYAFRKLNLQPLDMELLALLQSKLAVPGNEPVDVSKKRLASLRRQVDPQLKSVLRKRDFGEFSLGRAFRTVASMASRLADQR
jgi:predicted nucleotidyltransferase component of viral defense system